MNPLGMSKQDRAEFERLSCLDGNRDCTLLRQRLGSMVWDDNERVLPDGVVEFIASIDAAWLRSAGRQELAWWSKTVPRRTRNKMKIFFPKTISWKKTGNKTTRALRLDRYSKASLENATRVSLCDQIDVLMRVGLHHGARCLADCNPRLLRTLLHGLNPSWARYLMLFHVTLYDSNRCRLRAPVMRQYWIEEKK